ncbi:MAG: cytochrome c oxidase assembly protein [Polyangiales bacterium]
MTTWHVLTDLWRFDSLSWLVAIAALGAYGWAFGVRPGVRLAAMLGAVGTFLLATVSPIAVLADGYLFSAHVVQHLLLLLVIPPLLIASLPPDRVAAALTRPRLRAAQDTFGRAPMSWMLGLGIMWLWHIPTLCMASVTSPPVYVAQCATMLAAGVAFYWPVIHPVRAERLSPPASIAYLFTGCLACTLLGVLLTFAPVSACPIYMHPVDTLGILPLIQNQWQLTHAADQQLGGLMMWVPACMVYLATILVIAKRWMADGAADVAPERGSHGLR